MSKLGLLSGFSIRFHEKRQVLVVFLDHLNPSSFSEQCGYLESSKKPETDHPDRQNLIGGSSIVTGQTPSFIAGNVNSSDIWGAVVAPGLAQITSAKAPLESPWNNQRLVVWIDLINPVAQEICDAQAKPFQSPFGSFFVKWQLLTAVVDIFQCAH